MVKTAETLDRNGFTKEADIIDEIMLKYAEDYSELIRVAPKIISIAANAMRVKRHIKRIKLMANKRLGSATDQELEQMQQDIVSVVQSEANLIKAFLGLLEIDVPQEVNQILSGNVTKESISQFAILLQELPQLKEGRLRRVLIRIPQTRNIILGLEDVKSIAILWVRIEDEQQKRQRRNGISVVTPDDATVQAPSVDMEEDVNKAANML
jgi:hypothetical protein